MMNWSDYESQEAQMLGLAERVASELSEALAQKSRASLVVPGGTTPSPFLRNLSMQELDWSRVDVLLGDERFVPTTSPRSNTKLIRETLLQNHAVNGCMMDFWQPDTTPEQMIEKLRQQLPDVLDVCVLGMGTDMHTASLFPDMPNIADALDDPNDQKVFVVRPEGQETRLSLSAPVLASAKFLHLLIIGQEKKDALNRAVATENTHKAPIKALITKHGNMNVHFSY